MLGWNEKYGHSMEILSIHMPARQGDRCLPACLDRYTRYLRIGGPRVSPRVHPPESIQRWKVKFQTRIKILSGSAFAVPIPCDRSLIQRQTFNPTGMVPRLVSQLFNHISNQRSFPRANSFHPQMKSHVSLGWFRLVDNDRLHNPGGINFIRVMWYDHRLDIIQNFKRRGIHEIRKFVLKFPHEVI